MLTRTDTPASTNEDPQYPSITRWDSQPEQSMRARSTVPYDA